MTAPDLAGLEHRIARILRVGVATSTTCLVAGLALWIAHQPAATRLLNAGLVVLMAVPISRIAASFFDAIHRKDRLLGWATALVLVMLILTALYALAARSG
jgi:uncharacterized membrane protein